MEQNQNLSPISQPQTQQPEQYYEVAHYGRRILIIMILAYVLLILVATTPFIGFSLLSGQGLSGLSFVMSVWMSVIVLALIAGITMITMSLRYLVKKRLAGKSRTATVVSLSLYVLIITAYLSAVIASAGR